MSVIDWTKPMSQTYEYYIVNPNTWKDEKRIDTIKNSSISRDLEADTLGSASFSTTDTINECYIRTYLIPNQNGKTDKIPLGTYLVQTPSISFDGKTHDTSLDGYTPLIELTENDMPLGYYIEKNKEYMDIAYNLVNEYVRAPVIKPINDETLYSNFVSESGESPLEFVYSLIQNSEKNYKISLDEMGRILFSPTIAFKDQQPIWTFDDGNSSILYPDIAYNQDIFGIPNVVEVIYSDSNHNFYSRVVNDDFDSPISTVNRGREIVSRITELNISGIPTQEMIDDYANRQLESASTVTYTISYKHGYCPVTIGDCVILNYEKANLKNVKARIISQSIECTLGCPVTETAIFTKKLWEAK